MGNASYGDTVLLDGLQNDASTVKLRRIAFVKGEGGGNYNEDWIQELIMKHPGLLPVAKVEPGFESMVPVCRELPLRAGYVDNVFVTPQGDIAIVECKLWRNPEARRKVIAQVIDYASELTTLNYSEFEAAILKARRGDAVDSKKTESLFSLVNVDDDGGEAVFHDNVSRNLRRGRLLLLIVGDGIQEGLETMADFLQKYANLHFDLCLIEIALFELPDKRLIAQPRILGKTLNIKRDIVVFREQAVAAGFDEQAPQSFSSAVTSISSEDFYEHLDAAIPGTGAKFRQFVGRVIDEVRGVQPDFRPKTLTLRWTDETGSWNLGTVKNDGSVWLDYHAQQARNLNLSEESKRYLQALAAIAGNVQVVPMGTGWNLRKIGGGSATIDLFLSDDGENRWMDAMSRFLKEVSEKRQD